MPELARRKICISRNAAFERRIEQEGLRKRNAQQFTVGNLRSLKCTLLHLHIGDVALFQRAVDERSAGKRAAGEAAADKAAGAECQSGVVAAFEHEIFKENVFDILLFLTRVKKQRLDIIAWRQVAPDGAFLLRILFHKTEFNTVSRTRTAKKEEMRKFATLFLMIL